MDNIKPHELSPEDIRASWARQVDNAVARYRGTATKEPLLVEDLVQQLRDASELHERGLREAA